MAYDVVIRGGEIVDGSGGDRFTADVGIKGDRIATIGKIAERGAREIDAEGHIVTPGFIDGHTHLDAQVNWDPLCSSSCYQGVTSVVMGNCGFTLAPSRADGRGLVTRNLERAEDISAAAMALGIKWGWETFPEYLDFLEKLPKGMNHAVYVGHSALRTWAMGERAFEAQASEDELAAMIGQLKAGVQAGAVGLSTSRSAQHETSDDRPVASRVGSWDEVHRMVRSLGDMGKGMFEVATGGIAVPQELQDIAVDTGVPVTFGVIPVGDKGGKIQLDAIDAVIARGGRMIGQTHCKGVTLLLSFQAGLPFDRLPTWAAFRSRPLAEQEKLLRTDPALRAKLVDAVHNEAYPRTLGTELRKPDWDLIEVQTAPLPPYDTLADLAKAQGRDPVEVMIDLALASPNMSQTFVQKLAAMREAEHLEVLRHPETVMTFSDTGAHVSQISDGSLYTYMLSYWVRQRQVFTLEEAVRMITARPAETWSLKDRGLLREGMLADINVIDFQGLQPRVPRVVTDLPGGSKRYLQEADGFRATLVNGQVLMDGGVHTGALPGRLMRQ